MKRSEAKEMMDLPGNPHWLLEEDLANLRAFNRHFGGYRSARRGLQRLIDHKKLDRFSLLDVGTGSGDIPAALAGWARSRGIAAAFTALEVEPVTLAAAARQTSNYSEINLVRGDGLAPPFQAGSFDFVFASQFLHHFSENHIVTLLRTWSGIARRAIIVSDLVRHPVAYYGIRSLTRLVTRNVMTLTDAPLSVQRAFTMKEWRELFRRAEVGPVEIFSLFPFRVLALISTAGGHAYV
jgi:2-polyprenyl-3-methyl-5-hydroxy-6-metoxy-1,4-benzoquinol methylase